MEVAPVERKVHLGKHSPIRVFDLVNFLGRTQLPKNPVEVAEKLSERLSLSLLKYYRKEGKTIVSSYESLTGDQGRQFEFVLTIEKVQ